MSIMMSPFRMPLPYCVGMRWIIMKGGEVVDIMWIILGKWLIETLILNRLYTPTVLEPVAEIKKET
jgi:hypothetical protein